MNSAIERLCRRATELTAGMTDDAYYATRLMILDTVGCLLLGRTHPRFSTLRRACPSSITGNSAMASFAIPQAIAIHLDEFDSIDVRSATVPMCIVVPIALSAARHEAISLDRVCQIVAGSTQVIVDAGNLLGSTRQYKMGRWPTAYAGAAGAAWAVSSLMGLSAEEQITATAIAAQIAGGLLGTGPIPESHYLLPALTIANGFQASRASAVGIQGNTALWDDHASTTTDTPPGDRLAVETCEVKFYPFSRPLHGAIRSVEAWAKENDPGQVVSAVLYLPSDISSFINTIPFPDSAGVAAASASFAIASALAGKAASPDSVRGGAAVRHIPTTIRDTLIGKEQHNGQWDSMLELELDDGRLMTVPVPYTPGPSSGLEAAILDKWQRSLGVTDARKAAGLATLILEAPLETPARRVFSSLEEGFEAAEATGFEVGRKEGVTRRNER